MGILNPVGDGNASYVVNAAVVEEMVMEAGAISAESAASSFAFNAIPKEGEPLSATSLPLTANVLRKAP